MAFEAFLRIAVSPEAAAAPVLISALWLEKNRAALRAAARPAIPPAVSGA